MGLYRGLAVGSEILAVVLGSLVLLAGTEWPFYLAGLCGVICALGFYGIAQTGGQAKRRGQVRRGGLTKGAGITVRRRDGGPDLHRGAESGTVWLFAPLFPPPASASPIMGLAMPSPHSRR